MLTKLHSLYIANKQFTAVPVFSERFLVFHTPLDFKREREYYRGVSNNKFKHMPGRNTPEGGVPNSEDTKSDSKELGQRIWDFVKELDLVVPEFKGKEIEWGDRRSGIVEDMGVNGVSEIIDKLSDIRDTVVNVIVDGAKGDDIRVEQIRYSAEARITYLINQRFPEYKKWFMISEKAMRARYQELRAIQPAQLIGEELGEAIYFTNLRRRNIGLIGEAENRRGYSYPGVGVEEEIDINQRFWELREEEQKRWLANNPK
ncbi:MAG: hypothetical protein Q7S48_03320 [bacterium]|nr:hypothetical protein [bacterium]